MAAIHLEQTTTATPEQFVVGLTDFGPGRSKLFWEAARARPTPSRGSPTGRPTWTSSWYARARASRDG
jgi:hypothetical protein